MTNVVKYPMIMKNHIMNYEREFSYMSSEFSIKLLIRKIEQYLRRFVYVLAAPQLGFGIA